VKRALPARVAIPARRRLVPWPGVPIQRFEPWLFVLPALAFVGATFGYPLVDLVRTSFTTTAGTAGLKNFRDLIADPSFRLAVEHNAKLLLAVPILTVLAILLAILLFEGIRLWRVYRTLIFLPVTISIPVVGGIWGLMLEFNGGLNTILRSVRLDWLAQDWLGSTRFALWSVLVVIVWAQLGFGVVLFLARLLSISPELYEAARIDGANWWQLHRHVTLPQLRAITQFYVLLGTITMLSWVFSYVYVMTSGGPADATLVSELYIYRSAFVYNQIGIASAAAVLLLAAVVVFVFLFFRLTDREDTD
jgi:ABC-type sugar transport system permease subunit